jgi:vitamin B12 transporter
LLRPLFILLAPVGVPISPATAQPAATMPMLSPITVTATRSPQSLERLVADLTVIGSDEIARSGAQNLAELLQRYGGIEISTNGGPGSTSAIFIRGANRGQTLLLVDGLRTGSSSVGAPTPEAVPLDQIERIEILRGPASSLYGADAIGGVIQVFTRQPGEGFAGDASAGYGTYETITGAAGLSGSMGAFRFSLRGGGRRSDGFNATTDPASFVYNPDRDGYHSEDLGLNTALTLAPGQELFAQYLRNRLDAQFDGGPDYDDRTLTTLETWQVGSRNRILEGWLSRVIVGESIDDSVSKTAFGDSPFKTTQRLYTWQNDVTLPFGLLTLAGERREERLAESAGFEVTRRDTNSATAILQATVGPHALQANLRHDNSSQYGGETTGTAAWGWAFAPGWRATASYGTGFKPPSFNDLYFPGFSNPDLVPEQSRNLEGGFRWNGRLGEVDSEARVTAWRNRVRELIVFQCDASFVCAPQNVDRATLSGVSLAFDGRWRDTSFRASVDLQDPEDDTTGNLLPRRARHHGALVVAHRFGPARLGAEMVASSHRYDDAANTIRLGGYAIFNLTVEWPLAHGVTLFARGDNVTDRDYQLAYGYATGGAQWFAGVRWQP